MRSNAVRPVPACLQLCFRGENTATRPQEFRKSLELRFSLALTVFWRRKHTHTPVFRHSVPETPSHGAESSEHPDVTDQIQHRQSRCEKPADCLTT